MPPFQFRLLTLLRLRIADRDERRGELAKAQRAADILRQQREQLETDLADNQNLSRRMKSPGAVNVDSLLQISRFELLLKAQRQHLLSQEKQVAAEIERRRQILVEADRQVRVLEKLDENQRRQHSRLESQAAAKELDEIAGLGQRRNQEVTR